MANVKIWVASKDENHENDDEWDLCWNQPTNNERRFYIE
jgi:hypothetical protein